ncbi:hypothetical protein TNCV_65381 [Trichonephila clavipes]|nr:hypothetical protein TNCV_65381 [Trichonephila clavipes]
MDLLEPNDVVMADKGFFIENELASMGCKLQCPAFLRDKIQFDVSEMVSNCRLSNLELRLTDWKIKVNASKSACLMFTRRIQLPVGLTPVTIFGKPVPWVNVAKYLGLFLDAKLTFAHHIEQTRKKANPVHFMLKKLVSRKNKLAMQHKVLLFNSILR